MIQIKIKDINGKELKLTDKIRLLDEDGNPYGNSSELNLVCNDGTFEVRAFEENFTYILISNSQYSPDFIIL